MMKRFVTIGMLVTVATLFGEVSFSALNIGGAEYVTGVTHPEFRAATNALWQAKQDKRIIHYCVPSGGSSRAFVETAAEMREIIKKTGEPAFCQVDNAYLLSMYSAAVSPSGNEFLANFRAPCDMSRDYILSLSITNNPSGVAYISAIAFGLTNRMPLKTVNGNSLIGSGNIVIEGGGKSIVTNMYEDILEISYKVPGLMGKSNDYKIVTSSMVLSPGGGLQHRYPSLRVEMPVLFTNSVEYLGNVFGYEDFYLTVPSFDRIRTRAGDWGLYTSLPDSINTSISSTAITNGGAKSYTNEKLALKQDTLPYETNAIPASVVANSPWLQAWQFAPPVRNWTTYYRFDTVSYNGKIYMCRVTSTDVGAEFDPTDGNWMDFSKKTAKPDSSWLYWYNYMLNDKYAALNGNVSFSSVSASTLSGSLSGSVSGNVTVGSGKTLNVQNGATFTINGNSFDSTVDSKADARIAIATNAVVDQVHRITATNGLSAIDGDLGIYDTVGCDYLGSSPMSIRFHMKWDGNGNPYWKGRYAGTKGGVSFEYNFTLWNVNGTTWHVVCPEMSIDEDQYNVGALWANTLDFRSPLRVLTKTDMQNPERHGSVVPSYRKINGIPLTNDVEITGFLPISGGTMDGSIYFPEGKYADFGTEGKGFYIGNRHITVNGEDSDTDYYFDDGSQSLGLIQIIASREWTTQVLVRAENPIFSNAVLEVATNISTNDFAAIRAIADLPATEGAVTIGAILAALAAAVLALKRKKVDATSVCAEWSSSTTYGAGENVMYEGKFYASKLASNLNHKPTDTTWWDVCSLFTSANTSLVAVCREYGGTQIKQDENGNFYYEVEVED